VLLLVLVGWLASESGEGPGPLSMALLLLHLPLLLSKQPCSIRNGCACSRKVRVEEGEGVHLDARASAACGHKNPTVAGSSQAMAYS
jgi:hypothetical protein